MHMLAYGGYISLMISFGTLLMYMGVVHGGHILVHDALGGYIVHDSTISLLTYILFYDEWYSTSLIHE
jgi:hypothetical protein